MSHELGSVQPYAFLGWNKDHGDLADLLSLWPEQGAWTFWVLLQISVFLLKLLCLFCLACFSHLLCWVASWWTSLELRLQVLVQTVLERPSFHMWTSYYCICSRSLSFDDVWWSFVCSLRSLGFFYQASDNIEEIEFTKIPDTNLNQAKAASIVWSNSRPKCN